MWTRVELKEKAKVALKQNYWKVVLACVILSLIGGSSEVSFDFNYEDPNFPEMWNSVVATGLLVYVMIGVIAAIIIGFVVAAFVCNPLELGIRRFLVKSLNEPAEVNEIVYGFNANYKNIVKVLFFRDLYIFLWTLLFIIPGIVKAYEYFMVPYLLAENPDLTKEEVFEMSKKMMDGQKWNTFVLGVSFLGWDFLAGCTFGLLSIFYVAPYRNLTYAALFEKINAAHGYPGRRTSYNYNYGYEQVPPYYTNDEI